MYEMRLRAGGLDGVLTGEDGSGDAAWQQARMAQLHAEAELRRN